MVLKFFVGGFGPFRVILRPSKTCAHFKAITLNHKRFEIQVDGTLKPNYNSVDLAEVELVANDTLGSYFVDLPRYNHSALFKVE